MGRQDSTLTRVTPVFDELVSRDPEGSGWLPKLLGFPDRPGAPSARQVTPPIREARWGTDERSLRPPISLLRWMVEHPEKLSTPSAFQRQAASTQAKRRALLSGDPKTRDEALHLLEKIAVPPSVWYVLEGRTRPDVFIATDDAVVVIEGKRTEPGPTTYTSWLSERNQMLRHLDCAWEIRDGRALYGFYIVEAGGEAGSNVPERWIAACATTIADDTLETSLPHRAPETRSALCQAFLGACTWQQISAAFGIEL